eukprot:877944-Pyramimonas_sp.AAC.2
MVRSNVRLISKGAPLRGVPFSTHEREHQSHRGTRQSGVGGWTGHVEPGAANHLLWTSSSARSRIFMCAQTGCAFCSWSVLRSRSVFVRVMQQRFVKCTRPSVVSFYRGPRLDVRPRSRSAEKEVPCAVLKKSRTKGSTRRFDELCMPRPGQPK